ncbi:DUF6414 family protein [Pediococcus acidilactici]|uniref:Uncharacterized protein n=1 Tax=Pediococcus acidilactici TaxID=1254 RepID=A0AAW8YNI7_PEDAC|nr:hypothetical protein [Pediococcus acidilactici]MDV2911426.1 hypothetical protein [Pediococcus acidilactici]WQS17197.1 hypothetical protein SGW14_09270 [Pediococcus acidilactici]
MRNLNYKEIIYLDSIELNSYLSQLDQGLIDSKQSSTSSGESTSDENTTKGQLGASFGINFGVNSELKNSETQTEAVNESINIYFKDYQLQRLLDKAEQDNLFPNEPAEGDLIKITGEFDIFSPSLLAHISPKKIDDIGKHMASRKNGLGNGLRNLIAIGSLLENLLPETTILKVGSNATAILENNNIRSNIGQLSTFFGTSRKITLFGIVDSVALNGKRNMDILSKGISPTLNTVAYLNSALVDSFLSLIDLIKKDDLVVKPIAVYFE